MLESCTIRQISVMDIYRCPKFWLRLKKVLLNYLFRNAEHFLCGCRGADDSVTSCAELQVECETTDQLQAQFSDGHSIIHNPHCLLC